MHFSKRIDTEIGPLLPPPNNVGMKKRFQARLKCTGLHKLHYMGVGGKEEQTERHIVLIILKTLVPPL